MPTKIEWTDETWNPVRGCSKISPGCQNCYAERMAMRFCGDGDVDGPSITAEHFTDGGVEFQKDFPFWRFATKKGWTGKVELIEHKLMEPLRWRKPRRIFVNSMSDLFHEELTFYQIGRVYATMALCPQHDFQILTKRAERMHEFYKELIRNGEDPVLGDTEIGNWINGCLENLMRDSGVFPGGQDKWHWNEPEYDYHEPGRVALEGYYDWLGGAEENPIRWPLPNVHLGVSVENQQTADERIPWLLKTPAAVRFVSAEPLLGPVDFGRYLWSRSITCRCGHTFQAFEASFCGGHQSLAAGRYNDADSEADPSPERTLACPGCGGCVCDLKEKWKSEGKTEPSVGRFVWQKKGGDWSSPLDQIIVGGESGPGARPMHPDWARSIRDQCQVAKVPYFHKQNGEWVERSFGISNKMLVRVGKRSAGRLLDGVEWNECPADICVREEAPS